MAEELRIEDKAAIAACCNVVAELLRTEVDSDEDEERLIEFDDRTDLVLVNVKSLTHFLRCPNYHCRRDSKIHQTVEVKGETLQRDVFGSE
jgi:hypothetical protein